MHKRTGLSAWAALAVLLACAPGLSQAGEATSSSGGGAVVTSSGAATSSGAGTSALAPSVAAAPIVTSAPAQAVPASVLPMPAASNGDDATGKPSASQIAESQKWHKFKKKVARLPRKQKPDAVASNPEPRTPSAEPSFLDAIFGGAPASSPDGSVTDPSTTAATDPVPGDPHPVNGKPSKAVKLAKGGKASLAPAASATDSPLAGDDAPFATGELGHPLLSPGNIDPLKAAIKRYADLVAHGGWPTVQPLQMEVGTNNDAVVTLRQRLAAEGDLVAQPTGLFSGPSYFDQEVSDALKRFQDRYGLASTGDLMDPDKLKNGTRTVAALNVPAQARLAQLKANLARLQSQVISKGRYVLVNIPGEQIEAVENNQVALRLNGVVGKPERPSPLLSSNIEEVKFNPTWTLPPTVVKEDLIPKGKSLQSRGVDVLAKFGIDAYDGNGKKVDTSKINWSSATVSNFRFMQEPGKENPLGFAKLDFASPESVYMHDTPSAKLFDKSYRAASSGCIRVEHMDKLAKWLLKETDGWSSGRVEDMRTSGESKIVRLKRSVPLHWVYITAWATADGTVHFRRDLYGKDQAFGVSVTASAY